MEGGGGVQHEELGWGRRGWGGGGLECGQSPYKDLPYFCLQRVMIHSNQYYLPTSNVYVRTGGRVHVCVCVCIRVCYCVCLCMGKYLVFCITCTASKIANHSK